MTTGPFADLPVIGALPPKEAAVKLREMDEERSSTSARMAAASST
jgi:hypothetical protein